MYVIIVVNFREFFYVCYYDKKRGVYFGDVYFVKWMENFDVVCDSVIVFKDV